MKKIPKLRPRAHKWTSKLLSLAGVAVPLGQVVYRPVCGDVLPVRLDKG